MAQYKVPQDVEADDKLLGPFSFRQFVYLLIAGGLIALAVGLFQLFPLLAIIPVPFILFFCALALPLKKDQPMETYLAALVSYYLKPRTRKWVPGQRDTTIDITAPKQKKTEDRTRDITGEEATHRLSFLADIMDTEGYSIKGNGVKRMDEDIVREANTMSDMFETNHYDNLENAISRDENVRHEKVVEEMRRAIEQNENMSNAAIEHKDMAYSDGSADNGMDFGPNFSSPVVVKPDATMVTDVIEESNVTEKLPEKNEQILVKPSIIELANNPDFSIATISKEAKRIKERDEGEVFISLH